MKKLLVFCLMMFPFLLTAQTSANNKLVAMPITDYITPLNDSLVVVQVHLVDEPFLIREKETGVLKSCWNQAGDSLNLVVGTGKCQLIKGDYYYFSIRLNDKMIRPKAGDLVYFFTDLSLNYEGLLFGVTKHAISFSKIDEKLLFGLKEAISIKNENEERSMIRQLVDEVVFTGKTMLAQGDGQDQLINDGIYKGKKLFNAMQAINEKDVNSFLKYIIARPGKYAGHNWKFAEIFATWMTSGAPTVVEKSNQ